MRRRSFAVVSPVRIATRGSWTCSPRRSAASPIPTRGVRRFFSMSTASARSGETYRTRHRWLVGGGGSVLNGSSAHRGAASVLPEPVGARIRLCSPPAIAGQPCACAAVGISNVLSNHARTAGENPSRLIASPYSERQTSPRARPAPPVGCSAMQRARTGLALVLLALLLAVPAAALAQAEPGTAEPRDQIVLSGDVEVRRGQEVGEVVVLHGTATVAGVVRGDVVVIDGRIGVTGQVSGAVVSVGGSVTLGPSSLVLGDVLAHERVVAAPGARVDGDVREGVAFTFRTPIEALGVFAPWLAVWFSVLALGLLLLLVGPRAADAVSSAAHGSPWASVGWGLAAFVVLPLAGVIGVFTLVWLPLGLGLLLSLFLLYSVGIAWSAFALGRVLWHEPRSRFLAFVIGWAILTAVAAIPFVGGIVWVAGAVFGLGSTSVAIWRTRGTPPRQRGAGGRHRQGGKMPVVIPATSDEPEPMIVEREMGEEGAGL